MPVSRPRVETLEAALAFPPTSPSWPNQSTASHNREIEIEVEEEVPVTANPLVPDDVVKKYDQVMDEMKRIRGALGQRARRKRRMRVAALDDSDASLDMESETGAPLPPYPPALGSPRPMAAYPLVAEPAPPFRTPPEAAATAQATAAMADAKAINCSSPASAVGGEPTTRTLPTPFAPTAQQKSHRSKSPGFSVRRLKSTKTPPANPTSSSSSALSASSGSGFLTHLHSKLSRTPILGNRLPATQSPPEPVKEASARPSPRTPLPPLEMDESGAFIVHTARPSLLSPVYHATTPMPGRTLPALDLDDPNAFVAVSPVEAPDGWFRSQPGTPQLPVHSTKPRQLKVRNVAESDSQSASSSQSTSPVHPPVPCQQPTLAAASLPLNSISSPHSPPSLVSFSPQSSTTAKAPSTAPPSSPPPSFTTQPTLARVTKRPSPLVCAPTPATNGTGLPNGPSEPTPLPFTPVTSVAKHSYAPSPQAAPITATTTAELPLTATLPTSPFAQAYETHSSPPPMALADSSRQSLSVDSLSMESHISVSASTYPRHILRQAQRQAESQGQAHIPTAAAALMPPSPTTTRVPNSARQRWCPQNQDLSSRVISQHSFGAGSSFGHHSFSYTPSYAGRPSFFGDDDTSTYYHGSEGWGQSSLSRYRSLRKRASDSAIHRRHCLEQNQQGMKHLHRFRSVKETIAPISAVQGYPVDPPLGRWRTRAPPTTPGQWQDSVAQGLLPSPAPALLPSFIAASVLTPPPHPAAAELALDRPARSLVTSPAQVYLSVQLSNSGAPTLNSSSFKTSSSRDSTPPKATDCTASLLANSTSPKVYSMVRQPSPDLSPSLPSISETLLLSQVQPRVSAEPATILPVNYTNATPPPPLHEPTETAVIERPMVPPKLVLVVESMSSPTKSSIELDLEIAELDRELASMTSHLNSQSFIAPNTYSDGIDDFHGQDGLLPDAEAIIGRGSADGVGPTSPIVAMAAHAHEMPSFSSASMDPLHSSLVVAVDAEPRRWVNNAAPGTAVVSSTATHADTSHRLLPSPMAICAQPSLTVPLQPLLSPESAVEPLLQPNNAIDSHSIQSALSQSIPAVLPFSNNTAQLEAPMTEQSVERPFTRATTPPVLAPIALSPPATQPPFAGTLLSPNATVSATPTSRGDSVPLPVTHCSQAEPSKAPMPHDPHTLPTRGATADPKPANRPLPTAASTSPARTLRIDTRIRPADQVPLAPSPEAQRRPSLTNARSGARRASQRAARDLLQELESELSMELARLSSSTPRSATVPSRPLVPDVPPRPQWSDTVLHPLSQPATPLSPALSAELPSSPRLHSPQGHLAGAARGQATIKHLEDAGGHSLPNSQPLGAEPVVRRHPSRESLDILATMEAFPFPPSMRSEHSISQLSPLTRPVSATSTVSPTSPFSKPVMAQQRIRPSSQRSKESVMDALSSIMESLQHDMATPVTPIQRQAMVLAQREALSVQPSPPVVPEKSSPTVQEPINEPRLSAASAGPNSAAIASLDALLADLAPSVQAQADAATAAPTQAVDSGINSPSVSASCDEISPKNRRVSLDMPHQNALSSSTMSPRSDGHIAKPIGVSEAASQVLQRNSQTRSPVEQATPGDESATYLNYADYGATDDTMPQSIFSPASPAESATPATGTGDVSVHSEVRRDAQDRRISTERATNGRSSPLVPSASSDPLPTTESATNQSAHLAGNPLLSPPALQTSPQIENFHCHHEPFEKEDGSFAYSVQRPDTFPEWSQQASAGSAGQSPAKQPVVSDSLPAMGLSSVNHSPQSLASLTIDALSPDPIAPHDGSSARHRELSPIVEGNQKHEFASSMVGAQPSFEINDFSEVTDSVYARRGRPSLHSLRSIQTSYSQTRTWSISSIELSPDSVSRRPYFSPLRAGFSPQNGEFSADIAPETYPDMVQTGLKTVVPYLQIPGNDAFQRETIHINPKSEPPSFVEMAPPPTTPLSIGHRATEPTDVVAFPRLDTSGGTSALESESEIDSSADETEGPEEIVQFGLIASPGFATQANNGERVVSLQPARRVRLSSFSGSQKSIPSTPRHEKVTVTTAVVPFSGHTALAEQGSPLSADSDTQGKFLTVPSVISPSRVNGCQPSSRRSLSAQMVSETPRSSDQARSNENIKVQPMAQSPSQLHTDDERPPGIVATTGTTGHLAAAIPVVTEAKVVDATMARPAHMPLPVKAELPLNQLDQVACTRDDCGLPETITNGRAM
ncbi:hypothetical protein H4R34_004092, partial [Dimargaris verticillata]